MINIQVRKGIKIQCINENTNIVKACLQSGVSKSSIYRFTGGSADIRMRKLDKFCRLGLNCTLEDVLALGKSK